MNKVKKEGYKQNKTENPNGEEIQISFYEYMSSLWKRRRSKHSMIEP